MLPSDASAPRARAIAAGASAIFLLYSANFAYFFVDDEAIPFVYAQRVLSGRGLSYSNVEGLVEGYSNFLHVWLDVLILALTQALGVNKIAVFAIGKLMSVALAVLLVYAASVAIWRLRNVTAAGALSGVAFLALAGPLAVWAWSSLETTFFAAVFALYVWALLFDGSKRGNRIALICAGVLILARIDGFVYVGAPLVACALTSGGARMRELFLQVLLPSAAVLLVYRLWAFWYFGDVLPMPLYAKVLFKLRPSGHLITKLPETGYAWRFLGTYGWLPVVAPVAVMLFFGQRDRRGLALTTMFLIGYLSLVGDWMFGFRFFVATLPLMAALAALSVSIVERRWPVAGRLAAASLIIWVGLVAHRFERLYEREEGRPSWLRTPSLDPARFFWPYYAVYTETSGLLAPGDRIAYNQAGFLAFMRDLDNIDDLGICNRFCAKLPTSDVAFTEVGRYSPLTQRETVNVSEAYILYHEPKAVIARMDNLRHANHNRVPPLILAGAYELSFVDSARENAVYVRTDRPIERFRQDPRRFLENLAHPANLLSARINNVRVEPGRYARELEYLAGGQTAVRTHGTYAGEFHLRNPDSDLYELHVEAAWSSEPVRLTFILESAAGETELERSFELTTSPRDYRVVLSEPVRASRLHIRIQGAPDRAFRASLVDVRAQGQTRELRDYVRAHLAFPKP